MKSFRWILFAGVLVFGFYPSELGPVHFGKTLRHPSAQLNFEATAYCNDGITKSGFPVASGIVAADPAVLPLGSVIHLDAPGYRGIYRVLDTGRVIKGNIIDIYLPSEDLALEFGRQKVRLIVLWYGRSKGKVLPQKIERFVL